MTAKKHLIRGYYRIVKKNYVVVIADDGKDIIFVKEYRHGIMKDHINLPMGFIEPGETPLHAAKREIMEECGITAKKSMYLGKFYLVPSLINSRGHIVFMQGISIDTKQKKEDPGEEVELIKIAKAKIRAYVKKGTLNDASTQLALYTAIERGLV
ncbi:MAG: NUDIX hydrolase, partial [Nanoarchaeota archaeon]